MIPDLISKLISQISDTFIDIGTLKDNDKEIHAIVLQCHEVYANFYEQMSDISAEYSKADERLDHIRQELLIAKRIELINANIASEMEDDTLYLLKILDNNRDRIIAIQEKAVKCQKKVDPQKQDLDKNSPGSDTLSDLRQSIFSLKTLHTLSLVLSYDATSSNIASVIGPKFIACFSGLCTAISLCAKYLKRRDKKKSLTEALIKISDLLEKLLQEANEFNVLHEGVMKDLNKYLRSIDNMVRRSIQEGPLSHTVLADGMLQKSEKIQDTFKVMTTQAENNAASLRKELLRLNPSSNAFFFFNKKKGYADRK